MTEAETLKEQLLKLPRRVYGELLREVDAERRATAKREEAKDPVRPGMSRDDFARWVARQHHEIDAGVSRILYLPDGAPADEVRLIESNLLTPLPEEAPILAFPFRTDLDEVDFKVYVADVTESQFQKVLDRRVELPGGWRIDNHQEFSFPDS